jgi:hypothetical protein
MIGLIHFLVADAATLVDPIALIGYGIAGLVARRFYWALIAAVGWAILVHLVVVLLARAEQATLPPHLLGARMLGAVVAAALFFGLRQLFRRMRG